MRTLSILLMASVALTGCNQNPTNSAANNASSNESAAMICQFEKSDTRNWNASANADRSVTVTGQARVADPKYRAKLFNHTVSGSVARVYVTQAENDTGQAPPDGWWDVPPYTIPDNGSIQTVEIWCDLDKKFAQVPVRRGAATPAAAPSEVRFAGCPRIVDVEKPGGCMVVKSRLDGKTYDIDSAVPRPVAGKLIIEGTGLDRGTIGICQTGTQLSDIKWHDTTTKCPIGEAKE